ncbi:MAG: SpoIIE family protein phosphatase [Spirochaetota bacterium]
MNWRFFIFLFFLKVFLFLSCNPRQNHKKSPQISKGKVDLTDWNFSKDGPILLHGEWEFYWKQLVSPKQINSSIPKTYTKVPNTWDKQDLEEHGYASYHLKLLLHPSQQLGIKLIDLSSSYRIWINEQLVIETGIVGKTRETSKASYISKVFYFETKSKETSITVQISNHQHTRGGMWNAIQLGSSQQIQQIRERHLIQDIFSFGIFFMMAFYHLAMYNFRKQDKSPLFFSLFCFTIAIRILITGEKYLLSLFPNFNWQLGLKIEYCTVFLSPSIFVLFTESVYPEDFSKRLRQAIVATGISYSIITLLSDSTFFTKILLSYQILILLIISYYIWFLSKILYRRRKGAKTIVLGMIPFIFVTINDILHTANEVNTGLYLPIGLFLFLISQSAILSMRFSKAFLRVESISSRLKNLDKVKDEFLANTSHELRTPLNGIIGIADSLIDGATGKLPELTQENLRMISSSGRRLASLVNDILDFSKIKNGELNIRQKVVNLSSLVENVLVLSQPLLGTKKVLLVNALPKEAVLVLGDEDRILQILHNIIGNACKFTEKGEIKITSSVEGQFVTVCISDTGIGISSEKQERVFQSFEQSDASISREYTGTGLGLSISKQLVELQSGKIWLNSKPNKGSSFYFTLPMAISKEVPITQQAPLKQTLRITNPNILFELPKSSSTAGISGKILVVDDEPINLQVIVNQLGSQGFTIETVPDGFAALEYLQKEKPDLILLDVMMPKMSGYETCIKVREKYPIHQLPIILLTAKSQVEDIVTGFESGANDYLIKPFYKQELLSRVKNLLTLKKAIDDNSRLLALEKELEIASKIQNNLLPTNLPSVPSLDIAVRYIPMDSVGGDLYDFHYINQEELGILVADVSGHGVSASIISGMVKLAFQVEKNTATMPAALLTNMNENLFRYIGRGFVSAAYLYLNLRDGYASYANAGHPPMLFFREGSGSEYLSTPGKVLGSFKEIACKATTFPIQKGDTFFLYTDGIIEARNSKKDFYGEEQLAYFAEKNFTFASARILEELLEELRLFAFSDAKHASFDDDITGAIIKYI